ncbi:hypothetical protein CUZ93_0379 [Enterococcus xinjiangensis]|nr:hypothetical protein [Enterococcus lactis]
MSSVWLNGYYFFPCSISPLQDNFILVMTATKGWEENSN